MKRKTKKISVLNVLKKLHIEEHYPLFVSNEVDFQALREMSDDDLLSPISGLQACSQLRMEIRFCAVVG